MTDWWYGFLIGAIVGAVFMLAWCYRVICRLLRRAESWEQASQALDDEVHALQDELRP